MSTDLSPRPEKSNSKANATGSAGNSRNSRKRRRSRSTTQDPIRSADDCLRVLQQLAGMVAVGLIDTRRAAVIRSIYQGMLQHHQRSQVASPQHTFDSAAVLDKLRADPDLVNMLAPFLTADQLAELLRDEEENDGESL